MKENSHSTTIPIQKAGKEEKSWEAGVRMLSSFEPGFQPTKVPSAVPINQASIVVIPARKIVHGIASAISWETGVGYLITEIPKSPRDRKSTRLNSSHVAISYAVFCL